MSGDAATSAQPILNIATDMVFIAYSYFHAEIVLSKEYTLSASWYICLFESRKF